MENKFITIETHRNGYSVDQCGNTLTVEELIDFLSQWDEETPVFISNDNGYTYGSISYEDINLNTEDDEMEE